MSKARHSRVSSLLEQAVKSVGHSAVPPEPEPMNEPLTAIPEPTNESFTDIPEQNVDNERLQEFLIEEATTEVSQEPLVDHSKSPETKPESPEAIIAKQSFFKPNFGLGSTKLMSKSEEKVQDGPKSLNSPPKISKEDLISHIPIPSKSKEASVEYLPSFSGPFRSKRSSLIDSLNN